MQRQQGRRDRYAPEIRRYTGKQAHDDTGARSGSQRRAEKRRAGRHALHYERLHTNPGVASPDGEARMGQTLLGGVDRAMSEYVTHTGMMLKIGHLYPTLMSVAADRGNLFSIQRRCQWRGIETEVEPIYVKQTPDFTQYDLILFHGGADREMEIASQDLQAKAPSLREAAEANIVILSICA